jgi:hypothetical protein
MQKIATRVFIYASILFGVIGIIFVLTIPNSGDNNSTVSLFFWRLLAIDGFVVLSSFALSIAGKYLNGGK